MTSRLYNEQELHFRYYPLFGLRFHWPRYRTQGKPEYMQYELDKRFKDDIINMFWFTMKIRKAGGTLRDALDLCNTTLVRKGFDFEAYLITKHSTRSIKACKQRSTLL
jgi:hypothetical protein